MAGMSRAHQKALEENEALHKLREEMAAEDGDEEAEVNVAEPAEDDDKGVAGTTSSFASLIADDSTDVAREKPVEPEKPTGLVLPPESEDVRNVELERMRQDRAKLEDQLRTMKGMYDAQVPQKERQVNELQAQVSELSSILTAMQNQMLQQSQAPAPTGPLAPVDDETYGLSEEDLDDYKDFIPTIARVANTIASNITYNMVNEAINNFAGQHLYPLLEDLGRRIDGTTGVVQNVSSSDV